jgi:hypothetical protein
MRNSLYTIWLTYITSAIKTIDKKVLGVLRINKKHYQYYQNADAPLYIEENDSKNISRADIRILPNDNNQYTKYYYY